MTGIDPLVGTHEITSPDEMEALGARMGGMLRPGDLVVLTGALGAGKTTLTRGIAAGLGVRGPVQSPTFVLARTHPSLVGAAPLVHVDAYRLGSAVELDDLDIDWDGSVVVVEWGRGLVDAVADAWWEVELDREWNGRGVDTACGTYGHGEDLDADTPRLVTISRRP
ncbi:tRNA (adenosine(37)-N6)-threonylcarbamoyltransferase complex ATPase subunit type 1 TsaE [Microbacterium ulmi]|uniref:tRNA threonylcarbamoyladenosine biosynthesis protein TsaE n=1 Tax=Microbacterium ulmi TaxID=179095 RepID=A0A7Y2M0J7_9MICO|nr:tRNA (adenosine(37)-N6)-threonylcarbamoyltransferase complex ATPase subunit type 1 TsaE [Microbacterium ulmi]NII70179.1 tRNA threonylcarbamoyl adenosine modification protein YjeE [Microbacterium ulmi]NNH04281.1 tRNA (adenosine(37)-N6)-threonylcarbamoyltransferase complex ATPase subunit type 1 TsaE [Microbacterium ulmi]